MELGERLSGLLVTRHDLLPGIGETLPKGLVVQCSCHRSVKLRENVPWSALRSPNPLPKGQVDSRQSEFIDRRNFRRCKPSTLGHDGVGLELAAADGGERRGDFGEHQVDVAGNHILDCWSTAAIGHESETCTGAPL